MGSLVGSRVGEFVGIKTRFKQQTTEWMFNEGALQTGNGLVPTPPFPLITHLPPEGGEHWVELHTILSVMSQLLLKPPADAAIFWFNINDEEHNPFFFFFLSIIHF